MFKIVLTIFFSRHIFTKRSLHPINIYSLKISLKDLPRKAFFARFLQDPCKECIFCQPGFKTISGRFTEEALFVLKVRVWQNLFFEKKRGYEV